MPKLYFRYGAMGSSKTAQALITNFNYHEKGRTTLLLKPSIDTRDGADILRSRIGIEAKAEIIHPNDDICELYLDDICKGKYSVIIADEAQFFTSKQIDQLRRIVDFYDISVICYGLRTDFQTKFFDGSRRLMEIADSISEVKTICGCGNKAIINARFSPDGRLITNGDQIDLGGNEKYVGMCSACFNDLKQSQEQIRIESKKLLSPKEFIALIQSSGNIQQRSELTKRQELIAKDKGLVVLYGYSDDCAEFRGAIYDEAECFNGGLVYEELGVYINAKWYKTPDLEWSFETNIPHEVFAIYKGDKKVSEGIVFKLEDAKAGETSE